MKTEVYAGMLVETDEPIYHHSGVIQTSVPQVHRPIDYCRSLVKEYNVHY